MDAAGLAGSCFGAANALKEDVDGFEATGIDAPNKLEG